MNGYKLIVKALNDQLYLPGSGKDPMRAKRGAEFREFVLRSEAPKMYVYHDTNIHHIFDIDGSPNPLPELIDLPFEYMCIERIGLKPLATLCATEKADGKGAVTYSELLCALIREIQPGSYYAYFMVDMYKMLAGVQIGQRERQVVSMGSDEQKHATALTEYFCAVQLHMAYLRNSFRFDEAVSSKVKTGEGRQERYINITNVTHIRDHKFSELKGLFGGKLTYRIDVCGHWRRIAGIGVDRKKERTVSGATWVRPFVRGPKDAPIVVKPREVHRRGLNESSRDTHQ